MKWLRKETYTISCPPLLVWFCPMVVKWKYTKKPQNSNSFWGFCFEVSVLRFQFWGLYFREVKRSRRQEQSKWWYFGFFGVLHLVQLLIRSIFWGAVNWSFLTPNIFMLSREGFTVLDAVEKLLNVWCQIWRVEICNIQTIKLE